MSTPAASAPALVLDGVWKVFTLGSQAVEALRDVNVQVHEGEFVAITGPSGSGKTTLLEILGCLSRPTSGSYRLCGRKVEAMSPHQLAQMRREYIGFVFQSFNLLPRLTALENVELPLVYRRVARPLRVELARRALEDVGLERRMRHFPAALSGGECQRVAIARALVTRPRFILADEPTGNLDSGTGGEILSLIDRLHASGKSILMVTHDPSIARLATVRLRIHDGRIEADAPAGRAS